MAIWRNLESRLSCSVFGGADDPQKPQPGNDCGTFGLHSSLTGRSGRDLPLSCADPQLKFLRFQQKVNKYWDRGPLFGGTGHKARLLQEFCLFNKEIHWTHLG
jgi:hypothetical protein